ncbi:hypothetical protein LXD69_09645 [Flavobacterium sediminilitoris]|uniref:DUF4178 domain-containing protein n=1 Tax=Flavobacterium sediminilitoris TaxID=2024526 RepID=A0ABY4HIF0_9FLAO|nr:MULTISPECIES: hypothetical protein [Flavobacterium]UOX32315.1 hypothetical protein LXD69_09645 [Flavobacterium sediminilitoris]
MSTYKEFKNTDGILITPQQASQLDDYKEIAFENNRIKKSINYWDKEVQNIDIYIYPDEDLNTELSKLDNNLTYTIAKDLEIINGYKVWKFYEYKNGVLGPLILTEVIDINNRCVAYKSEESSVSIRKVYYLEGKHVVNVEEELDFVYEEDDEIFFDFENGNLTINVSHNVAEGNFTNINLFYGTYYERLPFMTPEILAYFTNPEPLVPPMQL